MNRENYHALFFDHIILNDFTLELLDSYSKLLQSNIIVLCLSMKDY